MTNAQDWKSGVGDAWAEMHRQTDRSFSGLTQHLLDRAAALPGDAVLDVGCGAGELAMAVARARPQASVVGLDISPALVAAARERSGNFDNLRFDLGNAATWHDEGFSPDLVISRHGVMFFDEPVAAFAHLRGIAAPGANLLFSCFRTLRENRWMSDLAQLLPASDAPPADPHAPGPFAFADPQRVEAILDAAGWRGVDVAPFDFAYIAGHGEDASAQAMAFLTRIGPAAAQLRVLDGAQRADLVARLESWIEDNRSGTLVAFPAAAWIVTAHA